jgi:hypothetical protein
VRTTEADERLVHAGLATTEQPLRLAAVGEQLWRSTNGRVALAATPLRRRGTAHRRRLAARTRLAVPAHFGAVWIMPGSP